MKNHIVVEKPEKCCGCGACANACVLGAIEMKEDEAGFIYPSVNEEKCVLCGKCVDVCVFTDKNKGANAEPEVYAAASKNREILEQSSSGGIFSEIANAVLERGGAVFGAAWTDDLTLAHFCVEDKSELYKLRGSKYVQSNTGDAFRRAKKILDDGRQVCYCATPCQISGLKSYLGRDYDGLLCVDLVCHGVPSMKMLRDDLEYVCSDKYSEIRDVRFRDKRYGWGVKGSVSIGDSKIKYNAGNSPYYFYFLKGELYRESCYNCRFPSEGRQGDITLGDYWGVRGELVAGMGGADPDLGISCVLVNTEKGKRMLSLIEKNVAIAVSDRKSAEKRNHQLTSPSVPLPEHKTLLNGYINNGYSAFRQGYKMHLKDHVVRTVKNMIPSGIKRKINDFLN
ncbi:MAG: Coenzyme F420 hydrogenase/dehydrogenase, beta subunit C-terminal domain [Clostridia bacterium]|nr:Coenzyme F420 hydrogenase/dehydrogenase, beta subunit C-terminal domain [Clostridia bacterium]